MSGMTEHPDLLLSAYLDDELAQGEHDGVRAHLEGCARCRGRVSELRATSRLIGLLPKIAPGRSLVPKLDRAPVWLRPVRLLGAMGSGLVVFLFLASAIVNTGSGLGGGTSAARPAENQFGAAGNASPSDAAKRLDASGVPAPAAASASLAHSPQSFDLTTRSAAGASPTPTPVARADAASTAAATETYGRPPAFGPPPQLFLALAALCAIGAFVAHRRLRRS
jgi:anti-sigma factor RsiW